MLCVTKGCGCRASFYARTNGRFIGEGNVVVVLCGFHVKDFSKGGVDDREFRPIKSADNWLGKAAE